MKELLVSTLLSLAPMIAQAAVSPCDADEADCTLGEGGWRQIAESHYDANSDDDRIWEKDGTRLLCIDPGPKRCANYGGDIEAFKADALKETAQRAKSAQEAAAYQKREQKKAREGLSCSPFCGYQLKEEGWEEIARCDDGVGYGGVEWSYILAKDTERKFCEGTNERSSTEYACVPFTGDLIQFKNVAAQVQQLKEENERAHISNTLDALEKQRAGNPSIGANCHSGFGQAAVFGNLPVTPGTETRVPE